MSNKITVKARKLDDVDVEYLSLVERGANRIPFRILKAESKKMHINIGDLFGIKKAEAKPEIVGMMVMKSDKTESIIAALKKDGYEFPVVDDSSDEAVLLKLEDNMPEDTAVIKVSDDLAVVVSNVKKGLNVYADDNTFAENITKSGFFPGVALASDVLMNTVYNIAYSEGDQVDTLENLRKSLDEYSAYVMNLANSLPAKVFKIEHNAEAMGAAIAEAQAEGKDGKTEVEGKEAEVEATPKEGEVEDKAAAGDGGDAAGDAGDTAEPTAVVKEPVATDVQKSQTEAQDAIADQMKAIAATLETVVKSVEGLPELKTTVDDLKKNADATAEKLDDVEKLAKTADESVRGTVVEGSLDGDDSTKVKKAETEDGLFDSAIQFPGFEEA